MKQAYQSETRMAASLGIFAYLLLASIKIISSRLLHSNSVYADGLNNLSDTFASIAILISLKFSHQPADTNHPFDHYKYETLGSLLVSILMFNIGFNIVFRGIQQFYFHEFPQTHSFIIYTSLLSLIIILSIYFYTRQIAKKTNSIGLLATSKDMLNDIVITIGTMIGTVFTLNGYPIIDTFISIIVGIIVLFSAYDILKKTTFVLSDGFDEDVLESYRQKILQHPKVRHVPSIRARLSGSKVYVDVVVEVDQCLTVMESHHITIEIEKILNYNFAVSDTDVHVEPYITQKSVK